MSIILVTSDTSAEIILRGPETKPRSEILLPGYTWIGIRLQPGVQLRGFAAQQLTDNFQILPADSKGQFEFEGKTLHFPSFANAEQLITQMHDLGYITDGTLDDQALFKRGMSSKSYSRLVKRSTGLSPYKLQQLQRITEALRLLREGTPVATVATDLGFADQAHLTRAAKQFLGHTPKELLRWPHTPNIVQNIQSS